MRLFDLHCDTLSEAYQQGCGLDRTPLHIDWQRGAALDEWLQVFAVWTPDTWRGDAAWKRAQRILRYAHWQAEQHPDRMRIVQRREQLGASVLHQCGALLALESAAALAGELSHIDEAAALGVKLITLTWNGENECGCGCLCAGERGLTAFGKAAVRRMEVCGILPDVSHLNRAGFWDVMELATEPVVASHSVSAAVYTHPRNLTDSQFDAIRDRGGLVGLNLCAGQLGEQSFEQIERHLDHFLCRDGVHTVAFGCDMDGTALPAAWNGLAVMPALYAYLYRKNYEEQVLDRLFFSNCYDFFAKTLPAFDKQAVNTVL